MSPRGTFSPKTTGTRAASRPATISTAQPTTAPAGAGAATALLLLSSLPGEELATAIASGDVKRLKAVKGIGAKTAERIIVDLRDKVGESVSADTRAALPGMAVADFDEALAALTMLGFERKQSQKVLRALYDAEPGLKVEAAIKKALSMM